MNILTVSFEDFKELNGERRVYYYIGDEVFCFYFLIEGYIVKSKVASGDIEDKQRFFSDRMFSGAKRLLFPLHDNDFSIDKTDMTVPIFDIEDIQDVEIKPQTFPTQPGD